MEYKEFKAKTVDDAITDASVSLGVTSDQLDIEVVEEGTSGILGIFSKDAVIRVRIKGEAEKEDFEEAPVVKEKPAKVKPAKAEKPAKAKNSAKAEKNVKAEEPAKEEKAEEAPAESKKGGSLPENTGEILKAFLTEVLEKMEMPSEVKVEIVDEERVININIEGDDSGDIIGKRGQTLDALQYLASIVANKEKGDYYRVKLDTKNYRERRQKTLENLAKNVASKVKKTRRKVVLEPMNPYERRIIHSYLQSDENVTTKSEGEEPNRRVVVYYKK